MGIPGVGLTAELATILTPTNSSTASAGITTPSSMTSPTITNKPPQPKQVGRLLNYLNKVYTSPKYKSLSPENQQKVKEKLYDRVVSPWYDHAGISSIRKPSK